MIRKLKKLKQSDFSMRIVKDLGLLEYGTQGKTSRYAIFECTKCNKNVKIRPTFVKTNKTGKCRECRISEGNTTHGLSKEKLHSVWRLMKSRCYDEDNNAYKYYGGRGISVEFCNYLDFKLWAKESGYTSGLSIDRINNDGNYSPKNCRWTTREVQARNTRRIRNTNKSGYRGVHKKQKTKLWRAQIGMSGRTIHLGDYKDVLDAAFAYDSFIINNKLEHTINNVATRKER